MIGTTLNGRYEILGEIGRGGMGVVYKGYDPILRREVAVKMISPGQLEAGSEERIQREALLVAKLDHPAIVPIHDLGRHDSALYLVMPLVRGATLRERLGRSDLRLGDVLEIGTQAAQALGYSHSEGVVHRDIKPSNLILGGQSGGLRLRIMDFGIASHADDVRRSQEGQLAGTLAYLSPEQVEDPNAPVDGLTDIYSLGIVLYECLGGDPPFSGSIYSTLYRILHDRPPSLRERGIEIDEELDHLVLSCLEKDPADRPPSGRELSQRLARYRDRLAESQWARSTVSTPPVGAGAGGSRPVTPLIGRHRELGRLVDLLEASLLGDCQLIAVGGEAGVGKSRLMRELEGLAQRRRIRVLRGQFSDWETTFPYQGLCELIEDFYRGQGDIPATRQPDMADLVDDLIELYPALSEISGLREQSPSSAQSASRGHRISNSTYVFELLASTLTRLGGGRPLVIILEQLHAAEVALEALQYLVRRLGSSPLLLVATFRSTEVFQGHALERFFRSFEGDPSFHRLDLEPLDLEGVRQLTEHLVGSSALATDLVERLHGITEGNPLFCQELVQSLREIGALHPEEGGLWTLADEVGVAMPALPATIQEAEERRLERLERDQYDILSVASVLGRSFEVADLVSLWQVASAVDHTLDLDPLLDELVAHGFLREGVHGRSESLSFTSGVLRDLLYQELSRRRRRGLHRRFAILLEERHRDHLDRVYPQLLDHFQAADEAEKTVCYGLLLARRSLQTFGPEDALRAARVALELVEDDEVEHASRREGELAQVLAEAYAALGEGDRALRQAERSKGAFQRAGDADASLAEVCLMAAEVAWRSRQMEQIRHWVAEGLEAARRSGSEAVARRLLALGNTVANLRGERASSAIVEELRASDLASVVEPEKPLPGGRLVAALANPVRTIDPARFSTSEEWEVAANVFETLLLSGGEGVLGPGLAETWRFSAEADTLHLGLAPGSSFSDGSPVTAATVKEALERTLRLARGALPPGLSAIEGSESYLAGEAAHVVGLEATTAADGPEALTIRLRERLPIYPMLLTDLRTSIARRSDSGQLLGTGPFRWSAGSAQLGPAAPASPAGQEARGTTDGPGEGGVVTGAVGMGSSIVLEPNPHWRGPAPLVSHLELRVFSRAWEIAHALGAGDVDVGRDMLPDDLEQLLRRRGFREGLVETVKRNSYFMLFDQRSSPARETAIRRAMVGVVRVRDAVWRTLGRLAVPAVGLLPPGVLGHEVGRRPESLALDRARQILASSGIENGLVLRAAVHPLFHDRFAPLLEALRQIWRQIGIELEIVTRDLEGFLAAVHGASDLGRIDLIILRWNAAYDDPDNFAYGLFNSRTGLLRRFFSSPEADILLERARREEEATKRIALYHRFEALLRGEHAILPLFHDIDYRLVAPGWIGAELEARPPYLSYTRMGRRKGDPRQPPALPAGGGELRIGTPFLVDSLDPSLGSLADLHEISVNVFETLTRFDDEARILPWLAESFELMADGRTYRFRLRRGVRFHDGQRLTARDVKFSFERLLRRKNELGLLLFPIRGARSVAEGQAESLAGFEILSPEEFLLGLHRPLAFFPSLLTHPATAILPDGARQVGPTWREGGSGTGPFRIAAPWSAGSLELERHPNYWRHGLPRADRLIFERHTEPESILESFRGGRLHLASDLWPDDVESLRRSADLRGDFLEAPSLSTFFLAFDTRRGPLADAKLRAKVVHHLDLQGPIRDLGRLVIRAHGLVPPGLLGPGGGRAARPSDPHRSGSSGNDLPAGLRLRMAVHPIFDSLYTSFRGRLLESFERLGVEVEAISSPITEMAQLVRSAEIDLVLSRWVAVFPDADCFMNGLFGSQDGALSPLSGSRQVAFLVEKGRQEPDAALRHGIYRQLEGILARENRLLPLFHEQTYRFARPSVRGLRLGITVPEVAYEELYLEDEVSMGGSQAANISASSSSE